MSPGDVIASRIDVVVRFAVVKTDSLPIAQVIEAGCCTGCGACAYAHGLAMQLNRFGEYMPLLDTATDQRSPPIPVDLDREVCPFLSPELNEDALAQPLFSNHCRHDSRIGYYSGIFAGHVNEGDFRLHGTSGGFSTWLAIELLKSGAIDGVIHVHAAPRSGAEDPFFKYGISRTREQVLQHSKSRYHVVEMSEVMQEVRAKGGRYLFVGVPCMCKSVRRLQRLDRLLAERIPYVVSLVCGHLKTVHWTLSLAWAAGIPPADASAFIYRKKDAAIPVTHYVFEASSKGPPTRHVSEDASLVPGGKWNTCAMMLEACDYCDDVVGETADISIGDAWLEPYTQDTRGTNLLIVRDRRILELIQTAASQRRVTIDELTADQAAAAQAGGLRHRREGLAFRLAEATRAGRWVPVKRVNPDSTTVPEDRKAIYRARMAYAAASKVAFRKALDAGNYKIFVNEMKPFEERFRALELRSGVAYTLLRCILGERWLRRLVRIVKTARQGTRTAGRART